MIDCAAMTEAALQHRCEWRSEVDVRDAKIALQKTAIAAQDAKIAQLEEDIEAYKRRIFGKKSEKSHKMPTTADELRKRGDLLPPDPEKLKEKRADGRKWKEELPTIDLVQPLPVDLPTCELCGEVAHHPLPPKASRSEIR